MRCGGGFLVFVKSIRWISPEPSLVSASSRNGWARETASSSVSTTCSRFPARLPLPAAVFMKSPSASGGWVSRPMTAASKARLVL